MKHVSVTGACNFNPLPELEGWVERMAELAKQKMAGSIQAAVWPYRVGDIECLALDLYGENGGAMSMTFSTGAECCDYGVDDIECADLTDALVMASLLVRAVEAGVSLSVGSFK